MTNGPGDRRRKAPDAASSDPAVLRASIERTRKELGDTVEALVAKADVRARVRDKAADMTEQARQKASQVAGAARAGVAELGEQARQKASQVAGAARARAVEIEGQAAARTAAARGGVADTPPQTIGRVAGPATKWGGPLLVAAALATLAGWLRWQRRRRR